MLIKTYILSSISAFSMIFRPKGSKILECIFQSTPFLKGIETPRELELPWAIIASLPHSFFQHVSESLFEWVSCKKIKPAFCFLH